MITEPISFKEAESMIDGRMDQATAMKYKDILAGWSQDARQRAFFSARVADATLLSEIHRRVSAVVNGSMTSKQAVRLLRESLAGPNADALAALGFAPKSEARGMAELASVPRLRLIIEQNARMAQECGHYQQWEAVKDYYPIGVWHCGYAEVHRQEHLERDGKAYEFDHPIWTQSPPGGEFNCHCWRENMTRDGATAKGLVPEPNTSFFQPSSLGFDPSQPFDASSVVPGKSVLPELVQKAKDSECPNDVLVDMGKNKDEKTVQSKRLESIPGVQKVDFDGWKDNDGIRSVADRMYELSQKYDVPPPFTRFIVKPLGRNVGGETFFKDNIVFRKGRKVVDAIEGQININSSILKRIPEMREQLEVDEEGMYVNCGCFLIKGKEADCIATHEFGHRIINQFRKRGELDKVENYVKTVYYRHKRGFDIDGRHYDVTSEISNYAATNWEEFWSECFSRYNCGETEHVPDDINDMVSNVLTCISKENQRQVAYLEEKKIEYIKQHRMLDWLTGYVTGTDGSGSARTSIGRKPIELEIPEGISPVIPENVDEIASIFSLCEKSIKEGLELPTFDNIPVGELLPVHRTLADLNLSDYMVRLSSPGGSDYGTKHWMKNHSDTINAKDALNILSRTLWNEMSELHKSVKGEKTRLTLSFRGDVSSLANMYLKKNDNVSIININLVDLWYPPMEYIESLKIRNK